MKSSRLVLTSIVATAVLIGILMIPLPHYVRCSFYVQPKVAENVFVEVPGTLARIHVQPNQTVGAGEPIATLVSQDLDYLLDTMERETWAAKISYETAEKVADRDSTQVPAAKAAYASYVASASKYNQRLKDLDRLVISAKTSGVLISPAAVEKPDANSGELASWHGVPLTPRNRGAYMEQRTLLGQIIPDDSKMEAVLAIEQEDIEFVQVDQKVELWVDQLSDVQLDAKTNQISPVKMESVPKALSNRNGGRIFTTQGPNGEEVPENTTYQVSVPINDSQSLLNGATGKAKVRVGSQTVGEKLWRVVCRTFRFEL